MLAKANWFNLSLIGLLAIQMVAADTRKIRVLVSQRSPFAVLQTDDPTSAQSPEGLDILILNEFAKKYGLEIEYSISDVSLHQVFSSDELAKKFFNSSAIS